MEIYGIGMHQLSLTIHANHLTSCTDTGVNGKDILLSKWRGKQELPEIPGKYLDCLFFCTLFCCKAYLRFYRKRQKPFITVMNRRSDLLRGQSVVFYKKRFQLHQCLILRRIDAHTQESFLFPAPHGKNPV